MEPGGCGEQGDACGHQEMEMDPEALPVYDASATHQEWKARYGKYIQTKTIFDYE